VNKTKEMFILSPIT